MTAISVRIEKKKNSIHIYTETGEKGVAKKKKEKHILEKQHRIRYEKKKRLFHGSPAVTFCNISFSFFFLVKKKLLFRIIEQKVESSES